MVPADRHLGSDAGAVRLASARGSYRTIARCCRHRDARLQVGASRAFGSLRAVGTTVAHGDRAPPQPSWVRLFPRLSTGPGAETGSSLEAEMRVDAVPQPASFCLPPPHLLQTVRTRAGKGDTRRGTEPWQEVGGGQGSSYFRRGPKWALIGSLTSPCW